MISYGLIALECIIMGMIRKRAKSISAMNMSVVLTMNANTTLLRYVSRFRYRSTQDLWRVERKPIATVTAN